MRIPPFRLRDRIKTKTVIAGLKYWGSLGFPRIKRIVTNNDGKENLKGNEDIKSIVDNFHILYDANVDNTLENTFWMGIPTVKCPLDCWIYQEILFKTKPDIIIETGTNQGGTTLFLAHMCDILGKGQIISIDIASQKNVPSHKRIQYLQGNSIATSTIDEVKKLITTLSNNKNPSIMVILDDDHLGKHVLSQIEIYGKMVTLGNYLIVEDTAMGGHPTWPELKYGPFEAVHDYLKKYDDFKIDHSQEKFFMTLNPDGYLKKIK